MKILLADDHSLVRDTLALFLQTEGGFEVVCVDTLQAALAAIVEQGGFDLIVLDYAMPGMDGLTGLQGAMKVAPGIPIALLSGSIARETVDKAIAMGAAGFVPKTLPPKSMITALRFMIAGETYLPLDYLRSREEEEQGQELLSRRELQVLRGLCEGKSNKEIAIDMGLQEVTIKLHVKTLSKKLNARNRTHAAMIARDRSII